MTPDQCEVLLATLTSGDLERADLPLTAADRALLAYAAKLTQMRDLLLAEMRRWHDPWRLWNQPPDVPTPPTRAP